ncbi:MAG TPA: carbamoyl phosphate synthase small subunit, partial [Bacillota bacterium]|nr:carbamoyl phosphate synthase small subunit [Bacillota bacterium]
HFDEYVLELEDGTQFAGTPIGNWRKASGEVVFNTSMCGYQEILTDPSYAGQLIVMTYPLIGNYGTTSSAMESDGIYAAGLVVSECCAAPSHWQREETLHGYLLGHGIPGLAGVDTRALTRHLRKMGTMKGHFQGQGILLADPDFGGRNYDISGEAFHVPGSGTWRVAVVDYGVKHNIIRSLSAMGADVYVFPGDSEASEVLSVAPDGVVLSNGPGDPSSYTGSLECIRQLAFSKPTMGICLGHQLLGMAFGAETYKLKYGHRGGNHPVKDLRTGRVAITAQNHGYALRDKISEDLRITHINLNDASVEGIAHKHLPAFSVQFHPEAFPGPEDSNYLFTNFRAMVQAASHA